MTSRLAAAAKSNKVEMVGVSAQAFAETIKQAMEHE